MMEWIYHKPTLKNIHTKKKHQPPWLFYYFNFLTTIFFYFPCHYSTTHQCIWYIKYIIESFFLFFMTEYNGRHSVCFVSLTVARLYWFFFFHSFLYFFFCKNCFYLVDWVGEYGCDEVMIMIKMGGGVWWPLFFFFLVYRESH